MSIGKTPARPARNQRLSSQKQRKQQHLLDVKVRSRAATRHRNRKVLAMISAMVLFCGAVGGIWYGGREALRRYFWQNPDYNLSEVTIHSDGPLTREQVLEATQIHEGHNIFTVNLSTARKGLIALPQVERAEIERVLPNKISIDIAERKPVAWVSENDDGDPSSDPGAFLVDRNGILLRVKNEVPAYYHLPVICGVSVANYEEGETLDAPEVAAALNLIHLTGENPAKYQVRSIDVAKGYCMVVTDERHAKITFPLDHLENQLDRLALLYANVDRSKKEIQTVNLLVQRNVPVTFVPPQEPDPSEAIADGTNGADDGDAGADVKPGANTKPLTAHILTPDAAASAAAAKRAQFLSASGKKPVKRAEAVHRNSFTSSTSSTTTTAAHHAPHVDEVRRAIPISTNSTQP